MNTAIKEVEQVVALVPEEKSKEIVLSRSVTAIELEAQSILIESEEDYGEACEFGRRVKQAEAEVEDFFRPMKKAAHDAHALICSRENSMLTPLAHAEDTLKQTMGAYTLRKAQERRAAEEAARKRAQEEAERKLVEASAMEQAGDKEAATSAMIDAQIADTMSRTIQIIAPQPKVKGVSQTKDWEILSVDVSQVPDIFSGMMLRPVDEKAVIRLIRASKGAIQIPGVTYQETIKTSIRKTS